RRIRFAGSLTLRGGGCSGRTGCRRQPEAVRAVVLPNRPRRPAHPHPGRAVHRHRRVQSAATAVRWPAVPRSDHPPRRAHQVRALLEGLDGPAGRPRAGRDDRRGYIGPPTQPFLGRLLRDYRKRYPLVSIHLEERTPERVWEMVAKGRLSAALTRPVVA